MVIVIVIVIVIVFRDMVVNHDRLPVIVASSTESDTQRSLHLQDIC